MSARDALLREMTHNHLYMTDEDADELIDAFAHELAEEQRKFVKEEGVSTGDDPYIVGVGDVIDLIDPHVGRGGPLSPASVQLPAGAEDRYPPEVIASMNQGPARPDEEPPA
ncbi:hypothetical protein EF919_18195 [Streptomyces sp. WAC02707]|uniref:hypothetical protein n=1 Tax=Streptomyces TaxID=1883 RepID=UPI000F7AB3D4|nr:hypothetical protein [Streptomyces sp. WAC02707]RSS92465.1 hypothetical protein EF919_18195 [Streptomyces sp. WAC02707]